VVVHSVPPSELFYSQTMVLRECSAHLRPDSCGGYLAWFPRRSRGVRRSGSVKVFAAKTLLKIRR
jgi:hypothetical protein